MKNIFKIILINLLFFTIILLGLELSLGHWFEKDYFGYNMRGKRLQLINFSVNNENYQKSWTYRRDYYGFREEFDFKNKYDLKKVKVVFNGGSTGAEMVLPYDETIVGNLNKFLMNSNSNIKIFNASLDGKSLVGKINDFDQWFNKLKNFNPEIMIFYMGINDRNISKKRFNDNNQVLSKKHYVMGLISQRSFIWGFTKDIKDTYFSQNKDGYHLFYDRTKSNSSFTSYIDAKKKYKNPNVSEQEILLNYKNNLERLKDILDEKKIFPVFITQIKHDGNGERILFYLNEELKEFALLNDYGLIPLDELISPSIGNFFIDDVHTNQKGSLYISKKIFPQLKKIINENF